MTSGASSYYSHGTILIEDASNRGFFILHAALWDLPYDINK
jgi:hypothetical protein